MIVAVEPTTLVRAGKSGHCLGRTLCLPLMQILKGGLELLCCTCTLVERGIHPIHGPALQWAYLARHRFASHQIMPHGTGRRALSIPPNFPKEDPCSSVLDLDVSFSVNPRFQYG